MDIQRILVDKDASVFPDAAVELIAKHDLSGMGDQQPQDLKLCLGERDHLLPVPHLMIGEVDRQHPALRLHRSEI